MHATRSTILQLGLDILLDLFRREPMLASKPSKVLLFVRRQDAVSEGKREIFVKLNHRLFVRLSRQLGVDLFASDRVEQTDPRLR